MEKPLVSICCISYNQERFIKDALEGFVMQKTDFPFEIVISDDCSKDGTRAIIEEYKKKYPYLFRDISPKENKGAFANFMYIQEQAIGKYIALCEGDDYWIDPLKLQKQVDFLENHPDYSMCCHGAEVLNETSRKIDCACQYMTTREYFPEDAFPTWQIPTASIVYRRDAVDQYPIKRIQDFSALDVVLILRCMHVGRVWGMEEHMSVYRMNQGGVTSRPETMNDRLKMCKHYEALMANFSNIDVDYCYRYIAMVHYTNFRQNKSIKSLAIAIYNKPSYVIKKLLKIKSKPRNDLFYQYYGC